MDLPASPLFLAGYAVALLGVLLHIIGLATTHWIANRNLIIQVCMGLFQYCVSSECQELGWSDDSLNAVRALDILGLLSGVALVALATVVLINKLKLNSVPKAILITCIAAGTAAFVFTVVGIVVYVKKVYDPLVDATTDAGNIHLGYSFVLSIVGGALLNIAGVLVFRGGSQVYGGQYSPIGGNR